CLYGLSFTFQVEGVLTSGLMKKTTASGGRVSSSEYGRPCCGIGTAVTAPLFPKPCPSYSRASLFSTSRHTPPHDAPTRYRNRGTGVQLHTTSTLGALARPCRKKHSTLLVESLQSTQAKPTGSQSPSARAGILQ